MLRRQQVKNFFCLLMLSNGTPMFCAGDEFLNTQRGNNNPYNQDNETTWLDWSKLEKNRDIFQFFHRMIAFRKAHPNIANGRFWREAVRWYGAAGPVDFDSHCLAYSLSDLYLEYLVPFVSYVLHRSRPAPIGSIETQRLLRLSSTRVEQTLSRCS